MTKQAILEKIEQRLKIASKPRPTVTLSLDDWYLIEDMILELSSPKLLRSIAKARRDYIYKKGAAYVPNHSWPKS